MLSNISIFILRHGQTTWSTQNGRRQLCNSVGRRLGLLRQKVAGSESTVEEHSSKKVGVVWAAELEEGGPAAENNDSDGGVLWEGTVNT